MTFADKRPGCCTRCETPVYEIADNGAVGRMTDRGTQVEFLLSDGTECDVTFCNDCAAGLALEDFGPMWDAVLAATARELAERPLDERARLTMPLMRVWPLAILRRRRESPESPGVMVLDRRARDA